MDRHPRAASRRVSSSQPGDSCSFVPYVVWQGVLGDTTATLTVHSDQGTTDIPVSRQLPSVHRRLPAQRLLLVPASRRPSAEDPHVSTSRTTGTSTSTQRRSPSLTGSRWNPPSTSSPIGCSGAPVTPGATCPITVSFDGPSDWKVGTELVVTTDATPGVGTGSGPTLHFRHDRRPNPPRRSQPRPVRAPLHARRRERGTPTASATPSRRRHRLTTPSKSSTVTAAS